jgi:hypothetical protein
MWGDGRLISRFGLGVLGGIRRSNLGDAWPQESERNNAAHKLGLRSIRSIVAALIA